MIFVPARIEACKINFSRSIFFFFFFRILEVISSYVEEDDESLDFIDQGLKRIMKMILFLKYEIYRERRISSYEAKI